jgi:hypothetical protein
VHHHGAPAAAPLRFVAGALAAVTVRGPVGRAGRAAGPARRARLVQPSRGPWGHLDTPYYISFVIIHAKYDKARLDDFTAHGSSSPPSVRAKLASAWPQKHWFSYSTPLKAKPSPWQWPAQT